MKTKDSPRVEGGYPLAAIALLVTTAAALLACIDMPRVRQGINAVEVDVEHFVGLAIVAMAGAVLGGGMGLVRPRRLSGVFVGASIGALAALLLIPLILAPANLWQCLAAMALVLVTSIVVRWNAR